MASRDFGGILPDGEGRERPEGLEDLLALYLARLNDGERLDRAQILAEQPDRGEVLRSPCLTSPLPEQSITRGAIFA